MLTDLLLPDHHWLAVPGVDPACTTLHVLVEDDGDRPVLVWYPADPDATPRPPDLDLAGVADLTGWGCEIERVWARFEGGFLWRVSCRARVWSKVPWLEERRKMPHRDDFNDRSDDVSTVCKASGVHAYSTAVRLTGEHRGCRAGAWAVGSYSGGMLAIGEMVTSDQVLGLFVRARSGGAR